MMKGFLIAITSIFAITALKAQNISGIKFQEITFAEALQQASQTGKLVFIDCYTSWCAPCKWMEKHVFINDSVYSFYNRNFINFKIDMEKGEGVSLREKYKVQSFPTYLFVNDKGDVVHRTASKMEVIEFINEGRKAVDPQANYAYLKAKYQDGAGTNDLLFNYIMTLKSIDRNEAQRIKEELVKKITDEELGSEFGWKVIDNLASSENDRLGKYLLQNKHHFELLVGEKAVVTVINRLSMSTMYRLIREKNSNEFFTRLEEMRSNPDKTIQRNVAMLEMEYYLETGMIDSFVNASGRALNGVLQYNDADLSFAARRGHYKANGNAVILLQSLLMARRAVELNREEYSNQGTLASICLDLKLKEEGLKAARKARQLAEESTSKIQKIAQDLLDKIEKL